MASPEDDAAAAAAGAVVPVSVTTSSTSKSRGVALDFKRRELIFDSFENLKDLRQFKRKRATGAAPKGPTGTLVYTFGAGFYGQLGRVGRGTDRCAKVPTPVEFDQAIMQVACGGFHSAALTEAGHVYTWGDGRMGQLGSLDKQHNMRPLPAVVDTLVSMSVVVISVACGQYHTAALTDDERVFTWGSGKYGQLGLGTRFDERYPKQVEFDADTLNGCGPPIAISCGDRHTCFITKRNKVLSCGGGEHGQLGHDNGDDVMSPKLIDALSPVKVVQVSCGATNSAAVTSTGTLYVWGFGENLHPKDQPNICFRPRPVRFKEKVLQVACGQAHMAILTDQRDVYCYGSGTEGQIGHGSTSNVRAPRLVLKGKHICDVAAGRYHTMCLSAHGVLYAWGCGESGQLGHNCVDNEVFPRVVDALLGNVVGQVACGEHHTMALSSAPYPTVSQDVAFWRILEDEELRLKKLMLRRSPSGLKSKEIQQVEAARDRIRQKHEERIEVAHRDDAVAIVERLATIKTADAISAQVADKIEMDAEEMELARVRASAGTAADDDNAEPSPSSSSPPPLVLPHVATRRATAAAAATMASSSSTPALKAATTAPDKPAAPAPKGKSKGAGAAAAAAAAAATADDNDDNDIGNLVLRRARKGPGAPSPSKGIVVPSVHGATDAPAAASADDANGGGGATGAASSAPGHGAASRLGRGRSVPDLHARRNAGADGNPLVSRILFFEKASSALRLVKASLEKETPQYIAEHTNVEEIFRNRERLDKLRDEIRRKTTRLNELKSVYKFMKPAPEDLANAAKREAHIKELNMKLLTLNTRQVEAEENKKNYELNILRMKDERLELSKKIESLRGLLAEHERLFGKVSAMSERVLAEKNAVDAEIVKFKQDMDGFRQFFAFQLKSYHQILINKISNSREQERKIREKNSRSEERKRERVARMKAECDKIIEEGQQYRRQLQDLVGQLEYYEERFHKIKLVTGLSDPQDIIDKFYFNEEIDRELKEEIAAHRAVIDRLKTAKTVSLVHLDEQKSAVVDSKWKDVDQLQEKYREVTLTMVRRRNEVEQMNQKLAFVQEGLLSLIRAIDAAEGAAGPSDTGRNGAGAVVAHASVGPNDSCLVILSALQHRLAKLTQTLGVQPAAAKAGPAATTAALLAGKKDDGYSLIESTKEEDDDAEADAQIGAMD